VASRRHQTGFIWFPSGIPRPWIFPWFLPRFHKLWI